MRNARPPATAAEVQSFLGLVNCCACFILNFATLAEPLQQLTRSNSEWVWGEIPQDAFDRLRAALTSDCVVAHYDQSADTKLKVDASPVGLGVILLQRSNCTVCPVAYACPTLTDVKRRYSQTEKEALAVVWACEWFHINFTFTANRSLFTLITSPWKLFTAKSPNLHLGLNSGHFACKPRVMLCYLLSYEGSEANLVSLLDSGFV